MANILFRTRTKVKDYSLVDGNGRHIVNIYYQEYIILPHQRKFFMQWLQTQKCELMFEELTKEPNSHTIKLGKDTIQLCKVFKYQEHGELF